MCGQVCMHVGVGVDLRGDHRWVLFLIVQGVLGLLCSARAVQHWYNILSSSGGDFWLWLRCAALSW